MAAPRREGLRCWGSFIRAEGGHGKSLRDTVIPPGVPSALRICAAPWGPAVSYTILYPPLRYPVWLPTVALLKLIVPMLPRPVLPAWHFCFL